ncbi:L,D-transpeptidase family protein [Azospirillum sp. sgz302134]
MVFSSIPASAQELEEAPLAAKHRIVISLKERRLYLMDEGREARSFPVAIGRPGVAIPLGDTTVVRKRHNPTWHPTASQRRAKPSLPLSVPPGPHNPLGKHALDLGWTAIAIHGTNEPGSIGRRVSSGCFRMLPADVEALFAIVEVGTPVRVVDGAVGGPVVVPAVQKAAPAAPNAVKPAPIPVVASVPAPPPEPKAAPAPAPVASVAVIPDPRCAGASAPVRRMICTLPDLAALDGRARGLQERFLSGLPPESRDAASYALIQDERRFDERINALCWIRKGTEDDPAVAASARACLGAALSGRLEDVARRIAELGGGTRVAEKR